MNGKFYQAVSDEYELKIPKQGDGNMKDSILGNAISAFMKNFKENYDKNKISDKDKIECKKTIRESINKFNNS